MSDADVGTLSPMTPAVTVATVDKMADLSNASPALPADVPFPLVRLTLAFPAFFNLAGFMPPVNSSKSVDFDLSLWAKTAQLNGLTPTTDSVKDETTRSSVRMPSAG